MMKTLYKEQGAQFRIELLETPKMQEFIETHADALNSGFQQVKMSDAMRQRLQRSNYIFSGMKTFHELNEAFPSLIDENGNRKPFEQFLNDVQKIDRTYNQNYLRAEYNFVHASATMAAKWEGFMQDGDRYNLQYRTAHDDRVRPEHAALDRVTLPMSDPFWQEYYPPNGWNCRCTVVQVRKSKYPVTPHDEAMALGEEATGKDTKGIFHFNPGIEQKTIPDYNPYTIRRCRDCDIAKGKLNLAYIPKNELCAACKRLHQCVDDKQHILKEHKRLYQDLQKDSDYEEVKYDKKSGGVMATHIGHIKHSSDNEEVFFGGLTSTDLENNCQYTLFKAGHSAILCDESKRRPDGSKYTALDLRLDGKLMDIRSITGTGNYSWAILSKNKQLRKFNARTDITEKSDCVCLYFEDPTLFDEKKMQRSLNFFRYHRENDGTLTEKIVKHVYCVIKGEKEIKIYDV